MKNLAPVQIISVFGLIFSLAAHLVLLLIDKHVKDFWFIYPTWGVIFVLGYFLGKIFKIDDHHHHH